MLILLNNFALLQENSHTRVNTLVQHQLHVFGISESIKISCMSMQKKYIKYSNYGLTYGKFVGKDTGMDAFKHILMYFKVKLIHPGQD